MPAAAEALASQAQVVNDLQRRMKKLEEKLEDSQQNPAEHGSVMRKPYIGFRWNSREVHLESKARHVCLQGRRSYRSLVSR